MSARAAARSIEVAGPAGPLEAVVELPARARAAVAVLCHPHPLQKGTMHNKVVTTLARAFRSLGAATVRFNFRGVGGSAGTYDDGRGESADALAMVEFARKEWSGASLYLGGFSFGGAIALAIAAQAEPRGLVTVAPAISRLPAEFVPPDCPWLLVQGDRDDVVNAAAVLDWARALAAPPEVAVLPGVGHFFHGQLGALQERVSGFFAADFGRK